MRRYSGKIGFGVVLLFVGSISFAWAADAGPAKPKAAFPDGTFDFGNVAEGTKVVHDFVIKNAGDADLVVQRVVPACGCTAASSTAVPIPAGQVGAIHVEFDSSGFSGSKEKIVRVYTNDPDAPEAVVTLKGAITPDVEVSPQSLSFGDVVKGAPVPEKEVSVRVRPGATIKLEAPQTFSKFLTIKEIESTSTSRRFSVSLAPTAPLGDIRDRVIVTKEGQKEGAINVPVFASIKGHFKLTPPALSFGIIEGTAPISRSVKLEVLDGTPVTVKEITSNSEALSVTNQRAENGYTIQVSVDPTKIKKDLRTSLSVVTEGTDEPPLTLNVYGILPPKVE